VTLSGLIIRLPGDRNIVGPDRNAGLDRNVVGPDRKGVAHDRNAVGSHRSVVGPDRNVATVEPDRNCYLVPIVIFAKDVFSTTTFCLVLLMVILNTARQLGQLRVDENL
jgi:hypothetical protein